MHKKTALHYDNLLCIYLYHGNVWYYLTKILVKNITKSTMARNFQKCVAHSPTFLSYSVCPNIVITVSKLSSQTITTIYEVNYNFMT